MVYIVSGRLDMEGNNMFNISEPVSKQDAATKNYVNTFNATKLTKSGDNMTCYGYGK